MKKIVFLGLISSFLFSCAKEEMIDSISSQNDNVNENSSFQRISDGSIFNQFGVKHNFILDEMGARADISKTSKKERYDLCVEIIMEQNNVIPEEILSYGALNSAVGFGKGLNIQSGAKKIINRTYFTENEEHIIQDFLILMSEIENGETPLSIEEVNNKIGLIENNILNTLGANFDETTNKVDKGGHLMVACAVAKYSYAYWYNVAINVNHPWHSILVSGNNQRCGFFCKIWKGIKQFGADLWAVLTEPKLDPTSPINSGINAGMAALNGANASGG